MVQILRKFSSRIISRYPINVPTYKEKEEMRLKRKFGWVAETTSLLNWRTGNRTGGSNPPASADFLLQNMTAVDSSNG